MGEASPNPDAECPNLATLRATEVAGKQWGVIGHDQLRRCGIGERRINRWRASGRLHERHPGVYAWGHPSIPIEGELVAALLYAGTGSVLSHRTAAWWWGAIKYRPERIEVSRLVRTRSLPEVLVHERRRFQSTTHRRFPITTVAQTFLDLAVQEPLNQLRHAVANAEYLDLLDLEAVEALLGRGRPGTAKLRTALERHQPRLADTRSRTERIFLGLWESTGMPVPEVNVQLHGWRADFLWRREGLVVETDGYGNHHTSAQIDRDRRMDFTLRKAGLTVNRYSRRQVEEDGESVVADVIRALEARAGATRTAPSAARGSR